MTFDFYFTLVNATETRTPRVPNQNKLTVNVIKYNRNNILWKVISLYSRYAHGANSAKVGYNTVKVKGKGKCIAVCINTYTATVYQRPEQVDRQTTHKHLA